MLHQKMQPLSDDLRQEMCRDILTQHKEILAAIRCGDSRAARAAMTAHTRAAGRDLRV